MSVRSRIKEFEELAKANDGADEKRNESKKRFHYPGNKRTSESEEHSAISNYSNGPIGGKIKTQRFDEFEADLQAAWSVRKNIHHQGAPSQTSHSSSAPNVHGQAKAGQYSRHGAIPAQQTNGPKSVFGPGKEKVHPLESRRSPLQERNSKGTPWNVKKTTYSCNSTEMTTKRPIGSPQTSEIYSPPMAKRKGNAGIFDMVRPTNDQRTAQFTTQTGEQHDKSEKVSYAKRMAQGYLRSMGMGEWTPQSSTHTEDTKNKQVSPAKAESGDAVNVTSQWKDFDDDDQDFDF